MMIEAITLKMIQHSQGNRHDIQHFLKVWAYARTIGLAEKLNDEKQKILEIAALCHDIACPFCRQKDGRALGEDQEREGGENDSGFFS